MTRSICGHLDYSLFHLYSCLYTHSATELQEAYSLYTAIKNNTTLGIEAWNTTINMFFRLEDLAMVDEISICRLMGFGGDGIVSGIF